MIRENQENLSLEEVSQILFADKVKVQKKICNVTLKENKLSQFFFLIDLHKKRNGENNLFTAKGMEEKERISVWHLNIIMENKPTNIVS